MAHPPTPLPRLPRRCRRALVAALLAAVALGSACSPDDVNDVAVGPVRVGQMTPQPGAAPAVRKGLDALRAADTGTYALRLAHSGRTTAYEGSYRLVEGAQRWSLVAETRRRDVLTEGVGRGDDVWVRLPQRGNISTRCWLRGPGPQVARATGLAVDPRSGGLTALTALVDSARGVQWADRPDSVYGTVDLAATLALVHPQLEQRLDLAAGAAGVVATLTLADGVLAGVRVEGIALVSALERLRLDLPRLRRTFASGPPVDLLLADPGSRIVILTPPDRQVVDLAASDARSRLKRC